MLNEKGIKSAHGNVWATGGVREMLRNPIYKGWICFGRRAMGKFHRAKDGEVRPSDDINGVVVGRPQEQWIVHKKPEIALVGEDVWDAVNAKIGSRGNRSRAARARIASYPLSGLVICGDCGRVMVGTRREGDEKYFCSTFYKAKACACNHVSQKNLLSVLKELITEHLFCGARWDALKQRICKLLPQWLPSKKTDTDAMKRELNSGEGTIATRGSKFIACRSGKCADVERGHERHPQTNPRGRNPIWRNRAKLATTKPSPRTSSLKRRTCFKR